MIELMIGSIVFSLGFVAGSYWKSTVFDNMPWEIFRWHNESFGYRIAMPGTTLEKNEKIVMALALDTSAFPEEGVEYPVDSTE